MVSTIVSLAKREIREEIPGLNGGSYFIPPNEGEIPNLLIIKNSYYWKPDLDGRQDQILVDSVQIASSIVTSHITSQLLYRADQHPALFFIPNQELEVDDVLRNHKREINEANKKQKNWFRALVQLADDDWQQLRRHGMISDIQRTACKELGLKREWLDAVPIEDRINCPFCGSNLFDPLAPICPVCNKVHNPARLAEIEKNMREPNPVTGKR
jgi:hypothetical protein